VVWAIDPAAGISAADEREAKFRGNLWLNGASGKTKPRIAIEGAQPLDLQIPYIEEFALGARPVEQIACGARGVPDYRATGAREVAERDTDIRGGGIGCFKDEIEVDDLILGTE
jgi:hypothetical protein